MDYRHRFIDERPCDLPVGKVVCVGRNYLAHIRELGNEVPAQPVLFMKPSTALVGLERPIRLPTHGRECHHELELAVLIGQRLSGVEAAVVAGAIAGYALAIDLTLRDVQAELKAKGQPWELAKAFDGACPISPFVPPEALPEPQRADLRLRVNGRVRQQGNTGQMMRGIDELIAYISQVFTLLPGDVVLTGTSEGVAALRAGDRLELELDGRFRFSAEVA